MILAALAVWFVLLPILGIWPPVKRADISQNNMFFIWMRDPLWYEARGIRYRGIFAQEVAEYWLRWAVALPIASVAVWLLNPSQYRWAVEVMAAMLAAVWSAVFYKQLDLIGRATEVAAVPDAGYIERVAQRLKVGTTGNFAHHSVDELVAMIRKRLPIGRKLAWLLQRRIGP